MKSPKSPQKKTARRTEKLSGTQAVLGRDIQSKIGDQLRALHDDIVKEGVPDRFMVLLERLDKASGGGTGR